MKEINTIDLWTEPNDNQYECFNGAFVDGFDNGGIPFDSYKIVKNCNCIIQASYDDINITNKHHAIVFYKSQTPVRLVVINKNTNIEKCIEIALDQFFKDTQLKNIYEKLQIKASKIDLQEKPIENNCDKANEIDVGSCDRFNLLYSMLKGSYTEDETKYGNFQSDIYEFIPNINIVYQLKTDTEHFVIPHKCAFINNIKTRIIPIQTESEFAQK